MKSPKVRFVSFRSPAFIHFVRERIDIDLNDAHCVYRFCEQPRIILHSVKAAVVGYATLKIDELIK